MFKRKNVVLNRGDPRARPVLQDNREQARAHSGVRPSLVNSVPCVSTGSHTLDRALAHGGVPLGSLTLLEEYGTTDFASALLKSMSTLSVADAREGLPSRVVCVGISQWLRALPSLAKPTRSGKSSSHLDSDTKMKIAWRYAKYSGNENPQNPSSFCKNVDFKSTLHPEPQQGEVSYVMGMTLEELIGNLQSELRRIPKQAIVRIIVPSFLHPAVYTNLESSTSPQKLLPFFASLKQIMAKFPNTVTFVSLPIQLYPRQRSVVAGLELLSDNCIELEPFDSGDENVQGFLHINRISVLTDRGEFAEQRNELSFRLTRHQFEVSPYSIPVEIAEEEETKKEDSW